MGKRDIFWDTVPRNEDDSIAWPSDNEQRAALARDIFGAMLIGAMDSVLEDELDTATGNPPKPGAHEYKQEAAFRSIFASMTPEQRSAVKELVKRTAYFALYWALVKIEGFACGHVDLMAHPWTDSDTPLPPVVINEDELPHLFQVWVERFSDKIEQ